MIVGRLDIDDNDDGNNEDEGDLDLGADTMQFYWVIWDGSNCETKQDLMKIYYGKENINDHKEDDQDPMDVDNDNDNEEDNKWEVGGLYQNANIIGSAVKILVSPEYETAIQCYNDIAVGSWVELSNICVDHDKKELIYDSKSKIYSKIQINANKFIQQRLELIYFNIQQHTNIITHISSIIPHHQYQSWSTINSILKIKETHCKYKIRGKCIAYYPANIEEFSVKHGDEYRLQFGLSIQDSTGSIINVIFDGDAAEQFFGVSDVEDLSKPNCEQLQDIGKGMEFIMNEASIIVYVYDHLK